MCFWKFICNSAFLCWSNKSFWFDGSSCGDSWGSRLVDGDILLFCLNTSFKTLILHCVNVLFRKTQTLMLSSMHLICFWFDSLFKVQWKFAHLDQISLKQLNSKKVFLWIRKLIDFLRDWSDSLFCCNLRVDPVSIWLGLLQISNILQDLLVWL